MSNLWQIVFAYAPYVLSALFTLLGAVTVLRRTFSYFGEWRVRGAKALVVGLLLTLDLPFAIFVSALASQGAPLFPTPALVEEEEQTHEVWSASMEKTRDLTARKNEVAEKFRALLSESKHDTPRDPLKEVLELSPEKVKERTERLRQELRDSQTKRDALAAERKELDAQLEELKREQDKFKPVLERGKVRQTHLYAALGWFAFVYGLGWLARDKPKGAPQSAESASSAAPSVPTENQGQS
jgi:hypothetical protein